MQRKNREISIFNMSALDLFASALGAFLVLAVVALPYYLKVDPDLIAQLKQCKGQLQSTQQQLQQCQAQNQQLQAENERLQTENQQCNEQLQQCQKQNKQLRDENKILKKQIQNAVKFALLGITTRAVSFVIVIDMSGSIKDYTQIMEQTMQRILEPFDGKNAVQIIGYSGDIGTLPWQTPNNTLPMNTANKNQAINFVKSLSAKFGGGTPTNNALEEALEYDVEAVLLLTDGSPDGDPNDIIRNITSINNGAKEIHTIAIGKYHSKTALVNFLQALSRQNRGGFIGVSN